MTSTGSHVGGSSRPAELAELGETSFSVGRGALPNLVVIGGMKCGTTALHHYLDRHPEIVMSQPKELNFFFGPDATDAGVAPQLRDPEGGEARWSSGNWQRGVAWYSARFVASAPVRGETSPGYTSPSHHGVAGRMASLIPEARLIYLVRDPVDRAVSQYRHHLREGTETRSMEEALSDPTSQYVTRGLYYERLAPFLSSFRRDQIAIVSQEELLTQRLSTLQSLFGFLRVDQGFWCDDLRALWHKSEGITAEIDGSLRARMVERLRDDAQRLRAIAGRDFPDWSL